jgi:small subunit ribosomal protein S5
MPKSSDKKTSKKESVEKKSSSKRTSLKESMSDGRRIKGRSGDLDRRKRDLLARMNRRARFAKKKKEKREDDEHDVRIVSIRRVAKVKAGGKRLKLSVMVVVGDKSGRIGVGIAKGKDVKDASSKATNKAKKHMIKVALKGQTIPHQITQKFCSAKVLLKPAAPGTGVIAGGAVRAVVEAAGIKDILSKELGSKNTISNVYATYEALKRLRLSRFS